MKTTQECLKDLERVLDATGGFRKNVGSIVMKRLLKIKDLDGTKIDNDFNSRNPPIPLTPQQVHDVLCSVQDYQQAAKAERSAKWNRRFRAAHTAVLWTVLTGMLVYYSFVVYPELRDMKTKANLAYGSVFYQQKNEKGQPLFHVDGDKKGQPAMVNRFTELGDKIDEVEKSFTDYKATAPTKSFINEQLQSWLRSHTDSEWHTAAAPAASSNDEPSTTSAPAPAAASSDEEDLPDDLEE